MRCSISHNNYFILVICAGINCETKHLTSSSQYTNIRTYGIILTLRR